MKYLPLVACVLVVVSVFWKDVGGQNLMFVSVMLAGFYVVDYLSKKQISDADRKRISEVEKVLSDHSAKITTIEGLLNYQKGVKRG